MPKPNWDLGQLSIAEKSALRRNAGIMMDSASMQALEAFYHAKRNCSEGKEAFCFAAMCMECIWRGEDLPYKRLFPELLQMLYQESKSESLKRRCISFLDCKWSNDGFLLGKIYNLVRLLRSKYPEYIPDFDALANDLNYWNYPEQRVQRAWLKTICRYQNKENDNEEEQNNAD